MFRGRAMLLAVALISVIVLAAAGCGGQKEKAPDKTAEKVPEKQITLKYAFFAPAGTFPAVQMERWAEEVRKRTKGKVEVKTFPGGTLLTAKNMYDGVLSGVADIGLSATSYEPGRFPLMAIVDSPVSFPNARVASLVLWDLAQEFKPKELADFKVITMFATEPAYVQSKKQVAGLDHVKGLELRSAGTGVPVLKALGAAPVGMDQAQVPEALQTGVIKGYLSSREVLKDMKYAEMVKNVTDYPTFVISFAAVMKKDVWDSLPADVQSVIDGLGREMALWTGEYLDNHVKGVMDWAQKEQGVKVISLSADEKAKWDEKLKSIQDKAVNDAEAKNLPGRKFMEKLIELRDKYSKEYK